VLVLKIEWTATEDNQRQLTESLVVGTTDDGRGSKAPNEVVDVSVGVRERYAKGFRQQPPGTLARRILETRKIPPDVADRLRRVSEEHKQLEDLDLKLKDWYLTYQPITERTRLRPSEKEKAVAWLLRKRLAEFSKPRATEDGVRLPLVIDPPTISSDLSNVVIRAQSHYLYPLVWCSLIFGLESGYLGFCSKCSRLFARETYKRVQRTCKACSHDEQLRRDQKQKERRRNDPLQRARQRAWSLVSQNKRRGHLTEDQARELLDDMKSDFKTGDKNEYDRFKLKVQEKRQQNRGTYSGNG